MVKFFFAGIDSGSCTTKAVVMKFNGDILGSAMRRTGTDFAASAEAVLREATEAAKIESGTIRKIVSTGYGRKNISNVTEWKTEIACHSKACYKAFKRALTVVDIGGQDSKIIRVDSNGQRLDFKMNRKCAAGTGAFLEETANRLEVPLSQFSDLAKKATKPVELGSFCTVFAATDILAHIRAGEKIENLVSGLFLSVIKRILEMDPLEGEIALTGGVVANNPFFAEMFEHRLGRKVLVPPMPQFAGAIGAALFAIESSSIGS
jgi:predicted CoA-substrate-specific enzyme activase